MRLLARLGVTMLAVWIAVGLVGGLTFDGEWPALLGIAVLLALVNAVVKPIATVLSLPFVVLTLGLFLLVVNAAMLGIVVWASGALDLGLASTGFTATFLGAIVVSLVTWAGEVLIGDNR